METTSEIGARMIPRRSFLTGMASLIAVTGALAQGVGTYPPGQVAKFATVACPDGSRTGFCSTGIVVVFCAAGGAEWAPRADGNCYAADHPNAHTVVVPGPNNEPVNTTVIGTIPRTR